MANTRTHYLPTTSDKQTHPRKGMEDAVVRVH